MRRNPALALALLTLVVLATRRLRDRWPLSRAAPSADDRAALLQRHRREARDTTPTSRKQIWGFAEVGYQEQKSSALLQQQLKAAGFQVTAGVADIPTAFVATFGSGKPVIGIIGEFDALPGLSQEAQTRTASRDRGRRARARLRPQPARHRRARRGRRGEGLAGGVGHAGTLRYYGTPAEEGGSGKVYMVRDGLFKDVDVAVSWHPGDRNDASPTSSTANITGEVPLPRHGGARRGGARPRPLGARRGRGDGLHGQHDARARAAGDAHPLHHHARRRGAEHRARLRRGVLLRAPAEHADPRRHLGADRQRRERRGARHRHDDGPRDHRRGLQRAAERRI